MVEKMSYLVVALGALLSLCGAFAIYAGYGIILVERGWAGVIAGATLLSGGIVTIALGFILHSLSGLHALLKTGEGLTPLPGELGADEVGALGPKPGVAFNPEVSMVSEAGPPPAAVPPAASLRTWPQRPTRPNLTFARNVLKSRGTVLPAARGTPESDFALPKLPLTARDAPGVSQGAMEPPSEPDFAIPGEAAAAKAEDEAQTRPASTPATEAPAEPAWNSDDEPGLFDEDKAKEPLYRGAASGNALRYWRAGDGIRTARDFFGRTGFDRCDLRRGPSRRAGPGAGCAARGREAFAPSDRTGKRRSRAAICSRSPIGSGSARTFADDGSGCRRGGAHDRWTLRIGRNLLRYVCRRVDRSAIGARGFSLSIHGGTQGVHGISR